VRVRSALFLLLLGVTALWTHVLRTDRGHVRDDARLDLIPSEVGGRAAQELTIDPRSKRILRASRVLRRAYLDPSGGDAVELFIAYYGSQQTGAQVHSPQNCLPGSGWKILSRSRWFVPWKGTPKPINEFIIAKRDSRQLALYWFVTRSDLLDNEFLLKWDLVRNSLLGSPTDAAFVRLVLPVGPGGLEDARAELHAFCLDLLPSVDRALPLTRRGIRADH